MAEEEYDLVPHSEVEKLKKQVEALKEHPYGETEAGRSLMTGIDELSKSIESLIELFKDAAERMKEEPEKDEANKEILEKLDELIDENKKIAKGVLAVADMIKDLQAPQPMPQRPMPRYGPMPPRRHPSMAPSGLTPQPLTGAPIPPPPREGPMPPMGPPPMGPMPPPRGMPPPPPPPPPEKKKGLFG